MPPDVRSLLLAIGSLIYVGMAVLRAGGASVWTWLTLGGLPLLLWRVWRSSRAPREGRDDVETAARSALRAGVWGGALFLLARLGPAGSAGFDTAANIGAGTAAVAALVALSRIPTVGGLLLPPPTTRSFDAAAFAGLLWGVAVALPASKLVFPERTLLLDPLAVDYATTTAALGSVLVLIAAALRLRVMRRLEVGVGDRASGALALSVSAALVAVPAALLDVAAPDRLVPATLIVAALGSIWTVTARDPTTVSSALRTILTLMLLGVPVTLIAGVLARQVPEQAGGIVLIACALAIGVGLAARAAARPLGPEQSRWLEAIDSASRGALTPEPDAAIRAVLMALAGTSTSPKARPQLWRNDPEEVLSVDLAGYVHIEKSAAPRRLYELALQEPERTLRADVLEQLQVRRPEVRPLLSWFESRNAFSATLVLDEDGPGGFLLLPRGNRRSTLSLEEARAIRLLADRISALLAISSAQARSRQRELDARAHAEALDCERKRLEDLLSAETDAQRSFARLLAGPVEVAHYSPAARLVDEHIERLLSASADRDTSHCNPVGLQTPIGTDAIPWAAHIHLLSQRPGRLLIVDATASEAQPLEYWTDNELSPLLVAQRGTLVLVDVQALSKEVQNLLAHRVGPESPQLVVVSHESLATLAETQRLAPALWRWLEQRLVVVPPLLDRAEDLRPLCIDVLAREGMRQRGKPIGVEPRALALLIEHRWPGNEAELYSLLKRAVSASSGERVTAADLANVGFRPEMETPSAPHVTPLPPEARRRPRPRRPRR